MYNYQNPLLPQEIREEIKNYIENKIRPGKFLYAILTNNLVDAVYESEHLSNRIGEIVKWLNREVPQYYWGCEYTVRKMAKQP